MQRCLARDEIHRLVQVKNTFTIHRLVVEGQVSGYKCTFLPGGVEMLTLEDIYGEWYRYA